MRKILPILVTTGIALQFCSCENNLDVEILKGQPKLVVYCFPSTEHDTTIIDLSSSLPASSNVKQVKAERFAVKGATITYRLNGEELPVMFAKESTGYVPAGKYNVVADHHSDDHISIEASAEGYPTIHAQTTIPKAPKIEKVTSLPDHRKSSTGIQRLVTLADDPHTDDYYAVGYENIYYQRDIIAEEPETVYGDPVRKVYNNTVDIEDEPALTPGNSLDDFFEYDNDYYQDFYLFSDNTFTDSEYTLRLNATDIEQFLDNSVTRKGYCVKLYKISPEYYRFVKSLNDMKNNFLGEYGLAPFSPTLNNVEGGLGCVGGYSMATYEETNLYEPIRVNQEAYYCDLNAHCFQFELQNYDSWQIAQLQSYGSTDISFYGSEYSLGPSSFSCNWCKAVIPDNQPKILQVEIQPVPEEKRSKDYYRFVSLIMKAGERTVSLSIVQTWNGGRYW